MSSLLPYLIKTVLCAALLYGYYFLALRNRLFHQWNRFYLLLIVPLSLLLPLLRLEVTAPAEAAPALPVRLLQVVSDGNGYVDEVIPPARGLDPAMLLYCIYTVVALCLLLHFGRALWSVFRLSRKYPAQRVDDVDFIIAPVAGTPFSFFRRVFWNPGIDPASDNGRQILQHELVHVREHHSLDKLLVQAALVLCWFNPVFWLLRAELHLVHEFIADRKSVRDRDAGTLAALILQAAYPQQYGGLTNPFFHRAIKRRLHMLNQSQKARVRYIGRVAALPLLALIGFAFAVRAQKQPAPAVPPANSEKFTVVIDAGHGLMDNGGWNGAASNGVIEDRINLQIAQRAQALNTDPNLEIVLTRPTDKIIDLKARTAIAAQRGARLFLSLHVDALPKDNFIPADAAKGFVVYVPADSGARSGSRLFGSALQQALGNVYTTDNKLHTRNTGVWVLKNSPCPAALLELGYINKDDDRAFISNAENQD
ncbi:MAG: N-acetylmuramoyl-L-alanine amidase, partial [Sphingobacteriales bacterium]